MNPDFCPGGILLLFLSLLSVAVSAVEPSPIEATGVIDAVAGIDASNWDVAPFNAISFTQTERIFQTMLISPGPEAFAPLTVSDEQLDLATLEVIDPATGEPVSADRLLEDRIKNSGLLLIYKGQIIHESYRNGLQRNVRHIGMSTSKSLIGMLAQIAIQDGVLDASAPVSRYVPEVRDKEAWRDVTVRHILDMRDGIRYIEDYDDPDSAVRRQDAAIGWRPRREGDAQGLREFVRQNLDQKANPAGQAFQYAPIQSDILGMIIEGATGKPLAVYFEQEFWSKIGAEFAAGMGTDGFGQAIVQGAISMTLPDFARVALLILNQGRNHRGEQIISQFFFTDLLRPKQELADAFAYFDPQATHAHFRSQFWVNDTRDKQFLMSGEHGQIAFFDLKREFAMVGFGSYPEAVSPLLSDSQYTMIEAILTGLENRERTVR